MGPINLAKIKAAHERLLKLDPDFVVRERKNARAASRRKARERALEMAEILRTTRLPLDTIEPASRNTIDLAIYNVDPAFDHPEHVTGPRASSASNITLPRVSLPFDQIIPEKARVEPPSHAPLVGRRRTQPAEPREPYCPGRCAQLYAYNGLSLSLKQWANVVGINDRVIRNRLKVHWTLEAALTVPVGKTRGGTAEGRGWVRAFQDTFGTGYVPSRDSAPKQTFFPETLQ